MRVFRNEKMTVWALSFMLSRSTTAKSRFIIAVLPHWCLLPGRTFEDVHRAIVWGWKAALAGTYPVEDHLGRPLTQAVGRLRFERRGRALRMSHPLLRMAFVGVKSDLQYDKQTFGFHSYDQRELCKDCFAVKYGEGCLYTEVGPDAAWRASSRTDEQYFASKPSREPLTEIPGWTLKLHRGDPMHMIYLGFALHLLGSCLLELCRSGKYGPGSLDKQLARAWRPGRTHGAQRGAQRVAHAGRFRAPHFCAPRIPVRSAAVVSDCPSTTSCVLT